MGGELGLASPAFGELLLRTNSSTWRCPWPQTLWARGGRVGRAA